MSRFRFSDFCVTRSYPLEKENGEKNKSQAGSMWENMDMSAMEADEVVGSSNPFIYAYQQIEKVGNLIA